MNSVEGVPLDCSIEEVGRYRELRAQNDGDFQNQYKLPPFRLDPAEVYEFLVEAEKAVIPTGDYEAGSAQKADDILVIEGNNGVIFTTEHATSHYRIKDEGVFDKKLHEAGTAALGKTVAEHTKNYALIPRGLQAGDANRDDGHPLREKMTEIIALPVSKAHLSIHGMVRAHASAIRDTRGFSVMLGIGNKPSEATMTLKNAMVDTGRDLGLNIGVNKPHLRFNLKKNIPVMLDSQTIATQVYSAPKRATRGWAESEADRLGKRDSFAAIQVEISAVLRVHPWEENSISFPTRRDREIGAYLGYHFMLAAAQSTELIS